MIVTVATVTADRPAGFPMVRYRYANLLADRGHEVHVLHRFLDRVGTLDDLAWFDFHPGVRHHFGPPAEAPGFVADVALGVARREDAPAAWGRPVTHVQGYGPGDGWVLESEGPVVCVSTFLADRYRHRGLDPARVHVVPNGVDHDVFRVLRPVEDRPPVVATLCHPDPQKGTAVAVAALELVRARLPEVQVVGFGATPRPDLPEWVAYVERPGHPRLAELYNEARVFVVAAQHEGFGLTGLEAMACGAALVTTDTGGSRDYATDGETALVADRDPKALAAAVEVLLVDEERRRALAEAGVRRAARFDWQRSADDLERILTAHAAGA